MVRDFVKLEAIIEKQFNDGLDITELKYFKTNPIFESIFNEYNKDLKNRQKLKNNCKNRKLVFSRMQRLWNKIKLSQDETILGNLNLSNVMKELTDFESTQLCKALEENDTGIDIFPSGEIINQILKEDELDTILKQSYVLNKNELCALEALLTLNEVSEIKAAKVKERQKHEVMGSDQYLTDDELCALDVLCTFHETKEKQVQQMNNVTENKQNFDKDDICTSNVLCSLNEAKEKSRLDSIEKIVSYLQEVDMCKEFPNISNTGRLNDETIKSEETILSGMKKILDDFKVDFEKIVDYLIQTLQLNINNVHVNGNKNIVYSNNTNNILEVVKDSYVENKIGTKEDCKFDFECYKCNSTENKEQNNDLTENNSIDSKKTLAPFEDSNSNLNLTKFESYRKSPNPNETLKRKVDRPNRPESKIIRRFKASIFDSEFKLNPALIFEAKDDVKLKLTKNKFIMDILRQEYLKVNNACLISFFRIKGLLSGLLAYGYCSFPDCAKYRFTVDFEGKVKVFRTSEIVHAKGQQRIAQIRGVTRKCVKKALVEKSAYMYRKEQILKAADEIVECGNMGNIQNLATLRKCKAEGKLDKAYHPDPFVDVFNMQQGRYKRYIQHLASPLTIYCWEKITFETLTRVPEIIKDANRTIHFDATGQSVRQIACAEKRVLIYKIILHIKKFKIVLPIVTAILSRHTLNDISSILDKLKQFCDENKLKWPFFERVCTDVSFALFGAVLKSCNNENVAQYLQSCFCYLENPYVEKRPKIIVQWCKAHYMHIICKDLNNKIGKNNALRHLLKHVMSTAFDLKTLDECKYWFRHIFIVLIFPKKNDIFYESYNKLRKNIIVINEIENENNCFIDLDDISNLESIASGSPFKKVFLSIYKEVKNTIYNSLDGQNNEYQNNDICDFIINKYCPFIPMWTNIMGILVDPSGNHISNAPIEFNFFLQKHIILKGKSIRPGEFIKKDRIDNMSTLKEIRYRYNIYEKPLKSMDLDEEENLNNETEKSNMLGISKDHDYSLIPNYLEPEEKWNKKNAKKQKAIKPKHLTNAKISKKTKLMAEDVQDIITIDSNDPEAINASRIRKEHAYNTNIKPKKFGYKCVILRYNVLQSVFYGTLRDKNLGFCNFLDLEDWMSLSKNNMLTNLVLDNAILCVIKENFQNVLSLPCQINDISCERVYSLISANPEYIIIPILKNVHFNLCILNLSKRKFIFIDSKYDNNGKYHYDKFKSNFSNIKNWEYVEISQRYKQTDGVSCGVYVVMYLLYFLKKMSLMNLPTPNEFRKTIKAILIRNSDCSSQFCCHCGNSKRAKSKCQNCNYWVCKPCQNEIYKRFKVCKICSDNIMSGN